METQKIENRVKKKLSFKRFKHTIGVVEMSKHLASIYNVDLEKVQMAALLHDYAKELTNEELLKFMPNTTSTKKQIFLNQPQLLHGFAAAYMAKSEFNITDEDILNAIKYHTTGRVNMSELEKIIYIADFIELGRSFPGVEKLRKITFKNLNKGILLSLNQTIRFVMDKGELIHPESIEARNNILINMKKVRGI